MLLSHAEELRIIQLRQDLAEQKHKQPHRLKWVKQQAKRRRRSVRQTEQQLAGHLHYSAC